ncbi:hypothetical protein HPB51_017797 [Rhipicephalus microplus]|uniref:Uncharacterized protein n=1 Tax=Rhipicephalus microplus TaxID=6941 RepID=A0A9J6DVL3_RHIMP|nr:hypothetical protein HPB51_017797 [Rhipicephalus microplus]
MANMLIFFAPQVVSTLSASLLIATPCPAPRLFLGADADTVPAFPDNSVRAIIEASSLPFTSVHRCTDSTATPGPKDYLRLRKSFPAFSGHGSSHCESMANMLIFFAPQEDDTKAQERLIEFARVLPYEQIEFHTARTHGVLPDQYPARAVLMELYVYVVGQSGLRDCVCVLNATGNSVQCIASADRMKKKESKPYIVK